MEKYKLNFTQFLLLHHFSINWWKNSILETKQDFSFPWSLLEKLNKTLH